MKELYEWLLSDKGKSIILSGWKSSGITGTVRKARSGEMSSLDPYLLGLVNKRSFVYILNVYISLHYIPVTLLK